MIRPFLALALGLALATAKAHADLLTYTMTGTVEDVIVNSYASNSGSILPASSYPMAVGDHISWMVRYDRSTPMSGDVLQSGTNASAGYYPSGPLVTNLVDQTSGYHVFTAPPGSFPLGQQPSSVTRLPWSSLGLSNFNNHGEVNLQDTLGDALLSKYDGKPYYTIYTSLTSTPFLPTLNLARLRLDQVPFAFGNTNPVMPVRLQYIGQIPNTRNELAFHVQVSSVTDSSIASVPEPGSLPLWVLGIVALVGRRCRRALVQAG